MDKTKVSNALPVLCAALGNIFWGFSFLFIKVASNHAAPDLILAHRFTLAALIMLALLLSGREKISLRGKNWLPIILLMATQQLYYIFESYGILYTNSTVSGLVLAVVPVVTIGTGALFLREYPSRRQALFCILPVVGVIIMTVSGSELGIIQPIGVFFLVCTCLTSAVYKTVNRRAAQESTPFERTFLVVSGSAVVFTVAGLRSVNGDVGAFLVPLSDIGYLASVLALSVLCSVLANILVNYAAGKMSVFKVSSFGALSTLCSTFAGVIILREPMTPALLLGAVLILVGIRQVTKK